MKALDAKELLFVCYTKDSTTVFKAELYEELRQLLMQETESVYCNNSSRPKKKSPTSVIIGKLVDKYVSQSIQFIAEVNSVKAVECNIQDVHVSDISLPYCFHELGSSENHDMTM